MNVPSTEQIADAVRKAVADAATTAIDGFAGAAVLAVGDVAISYVRDCGNAGSSTVGDSLASAYAHDLRDRLVHDADTNGLDIGDVHVSTQLARFAAGDPQVKSPVDDVSVAHKFPFAIGNCGALEASGSLTLHAKIDVTGATNELRSRDGSSSRA